MQGTWRGLISRLLVTVLISLAVFAAASPFVATTAFGATSTSFSPTSVNLTTGQSTTITIAAVGLAAGATGAQASISHTANTRITSPACVGVFASANINQATQPTGDLLACTFASGGASGTTGNVMSFTLTNSGGGSETISFNATATFYLTAAYAQDPAGTLNTLTVSGTAAVSTPTAPLPSTPTLVPTAVAIIAPTPIPTATTLIAAPVPTPIVPRTATPAPIVNPAPNPVAPVPISPAANVAAPLSNPGTLVVCSSMTVAGAAAAAPVSFTTPPGGPTIPTVALPAGQVGPVCGAGVAAAAGSVAVTQIVPPGFTVQSATGGILAGNTATATIAPGQTTTLTFVNDLATAIPPPGGIAAAAPPPQFLPAAAPAPVAPPPAAQPLAPVAPPPPLAPPAADAALAAPVPPAAAGAPVGPAAAAPVIPETESVALLAVGLAAISALAVLRRRCRPG